MKKVLIACLLLAFTSCVNEGTQVETINSVSNYRVEKLFEVEGVSVYRFRDKYKYVYFTNRKGEIYIKKNVTESRGLMRCRHFVNNMKPEKNYGNKRFV